MNSGTVLRLSNGATLIAIAGLCLLLPSGTLAHHCKGSHANDPGCNGGGGGADELALRVTFRCPEANGGHACLGMSNPDRIQGDADGAFVHGVQQVTAKLTGPGRFLLNTGGNKKTGSLQSVYWDFTQGPGGGVPLDAQLVTTSDVLDYVYRTVIHVNRRGDIADLRDMTISATMNLDMWGDLVISDGGSTSSIFVRFDASDSNNECPAANGSNSVDVAVTRNSATQWVVNVPPAALACVVLSDSNNQSNSGFKGDYPLGPFVITLDAL